MAGGHPTMSGPPRARVEFVGWALLPVLLLSGKQADGQECPSYDEPAVDCVPASQSLPFGDGGGHTGNTVLVCWSLKCGFFKEVRKRRVGSVHHNQ